jgi:hypothetical protein
MIAAIGSAKANAEVRRRWLERETDSIAGVKTDSVAGDLSSKRALYVHQPLYVADERRQAEQRKCLTGADLLRFSKLLTFKWLEEIDNMSSRDGMGTLWYAHHRLRRRSCGNITTQLTLRPSG